MKIGLNFD